MWQCAHQHMMQVETGQSARRDKTRAEAGQFARRSRAMSHGGAGVDRRTRGPPVGWDRRAS